MIVRWTKNALASIASIAAYIEWDNAERAKSFVQEIRLKTNALAEFPWIGRSGRIIGTREMIVHKNYIIPYRVSDGVVEILDILHTSKRWPKWL